MNDRTPFTYLIGWSAFGVFYYGVKTSKGCHPKDLWTKYFTSSRHVKECREKHGEPDILEIRRVFNSVKDALGWEARVLKRMAAHKHPSFLNKSVCGILFNTTGRTYAHAAETRLKIGAWNKGRVLSEETRAKISEARMGKPLSEEHRAKLSIAGRGRITSDATREKLSVALKGRVFSAEHNSKVSRTKSHTYRVLTPEGVEINVVGLRLFCRENGLKQSHMAEAALGKSRHHKGWQVRRCGDETPFFNQSALHNRRIHRLTSPSGEEVVIENVAKFCRDNGLDERAVARVWSGEYKHHKGWRSSYV